MSFDLHLLETLIKENGSNSCQFILHLNNKEYFLQNVSIINSPNPVNFPTTRGGVYFADKYAFKIKGTVEDLAVIPFLTKTMLGPNTEFREIKITTSMNFENQKKDILIHTNLTNSVQGQSKIELNMIIVKLQLC